MNKIGIIVTLLTITVLTSCTSFVRFTSDNKQVQTQNEVNESDMFTEQNFDDKEYTDLNEAEFTGEVFTGMASYYADKFHGRKTASGEIFDQEDFTAAHRTLPFGTRLLVTNLDNNKSVFVRVNDRGPFVSGRVLDLSRAAAQELDMIVLGVVKVEVRIMK
jgi:rare lipoprotein A